MSRDGLMEVWCTADGGFINKSTHPTSGTISVTVLAGSDGYTERFESYEYERAEQFTHMLVTISQAREMRKK